MRIDTSIRERDRRLRELMQLTGENTKTKALFLAVDHYIHDFRVKQEAVGKLDAEMVELLSTPELKLSREVETSVDPGESLY